MRGMKRTDDVRPKGEAKREDASTHPKTREIDADRRKVIAAAVAIEVETCC